MLSLQSVMDNAAHIMPLFALICCGYIARRTVLNADGLIGLNQFVYFFALPAMMFVAASGQPVSQILDLQYIGAFLLAVVILALFTVFGSYALLGKRNAQELVMHGLNAVFANYAYMGVPLIYAVLGPEANGPMVAIILAGNLVLICGAQMLMEWLRSPAVGWRMLWDVISRSLLRNPMFLGTVLGISVAATEYEVAAAQNTLGLLAPAAVPVALFALGASLKLRDSGIRRSELAWLLGLKLLLHPLITALVLLAFGIKETNLLLTALILTALPTGALVHVVAARYQCYAAETSMVVVITTLLSLLTVTGWISLAQYLMY